jgi:Leucine-rich repeat (LRR) protein
MNLMDVIAKAKAEKATSLDLSQQDLRILPKELFDIESLEELNLDRNKLVELPDELGSVKSFCIAAVMLRRSDRPK